MQFPVEDIDADELARREALFGPLADTVRELIDVTIRSEADEDTILEAAQRIRDVTKRLNDRRCEGGFGVRFTEHGHMMTWGNAVSGLRNAIAPPLVVEQAADGGMCSDFTLGAAYEGPPGLVHGGVCALVLDQVCGMAASTAKPNLTGTLSLRYRRPTPLGPVRARARIDRIEGVKTFVVGELYDADGNVTVSAEGVFILPAWARGR
ncbi:PaaI family thioesterase [Speluncibacter jeojiensis]|uniref:Acyl-coenzyme A thioesterase THEM4 n=1 Tax=Speluncibacter jeojiensis TaxID=2710754 RepID=A0A9X4M9Z5_9ACTN|nr:PaaI family thioesterase [Corynebacteriales bacterium D3-21]